MKILLDEGTTEFIIEDKGKDGYRFAIHNCYINYDFTTYYFCYGDIELITDQFKKFLNSEIKEVKSVSTVEPTLCFILCPKGAKAIRRTGEEIVYYTIISQQEKVKEDYYTSNVIVIEFDFCINGCCGVQHWSVELTEKESIDFCKQWITEMQE